MYRYGCVTPFHSRSRRRSAVYSRLGGDVGFRDALFPTAVLSPRKLDHFLMPGVAHHQHDAIVRAVPAIEELAGCTRTGWALLLRRREPPGSRNRLLSFANTGFYKFDVQTFSPSTQEFPPLGRRRLTSDDLATTGRFVRLACSGSRDGLADGFRHSKTVSREEMSVAQSGIQAVLRQRWQSEGDRTTRARDSHCLLPPIAFQSRGGTSTCRCTRIRRERKPNRHRSQRLKVCLAGWIPRIVLLLYKARVSIGLNEIGVSAVASTLFSVDAEDKNRMFSITILGQHPLHSDDGNVLPFHRVREALISEQWTLREVLGRSEQVRFPRMTRRRTAQLYSGVCRKVSRHGRARNDALPRRCLPAGRRCGDGWPNVGRYLFDRQPTRLRSRRTRLPDHVETLIGSQFEAATTANLTHCHDDPRRVTRKRRTRCSIF